MKRSILVLVIAMVAFAGSALAQAPERGQGGGGQGRGRGRGGLPPMPTLTGPVADMVNMIISALNNQDAAYLQKVVAPDAVWLDEDGHMLPAGIWINRLMQAKPAKKVTMTGLTGQTWDGGAWAAFSYTLEETTAQGAPNQMKGTNSMTFKKVGNDWQVALIHAAVNGPAISAH
ncbi:MAG TPA: nuclear transport factor 2 family protein [Terriglobia bacterium]|nr:nuclear transport factor 2 family protein [Terriglobia bacterium]